MKVVLLYPPVGNTSQPYLSLPSLVAYLKQQGVRDVRQYDLNLEIQDELLSPEVLERAYRWCYHFVRKPPRNGRPTDLDAMHRQLAAGAEALAPSIIESIEGAKNVFRTRRFDDPQQYQRALNTLRSAYQLLSCRYFPTVLNNQGMSMGYRLDVSDDILQALEDEDSNCFIDFFTRRIETLWDTDGTPDIAGISIGYFEQLIPGFTLARLIKQYSPETHVTVGGTLMSAFFQKSFRLEFFEMFDSILFFEAEISLLKLIQAVDHNETLDRVPNIAYRADGRIVRTPFTPARVDLKTLPTPDFSDLPLSKYLSPEPILPLAGSRGCYWHKCTFCTRPHFIDTFRQRPPAAIVSDMVALQKAHNAKAFFFVDECMSPAVLEALAEGIAAHRLDVRWSAYVRFEARLADKQLCCKLYASGLRMLYFGLESACQRIIDLMGKGNRKPMLGKILEATSSAGIMNMVLYFVGFPTESREEALETMTFLMENKAHVAFALAGQFLLEENSILFESPEKFGITHISPLSERADMGIIYNYRTDTGLSSSEASDVQTFVNHETQALHGRDFLTRSHLLLSA